MSLLTGEMANADVDAMGDVEVIRWPTKDLRDVRQRNPSLWTKIQSVIGHDLVEKIQRGERHEAAS
jgi:CRP-like cAMP-binding protein